MDGNHTTLARPTAFEGGHSVSRLPLVLKGAMIDDPRGRSRKRVADFLP